jgi:2-alkyl-3-oxoalkanoate reductase
MEFTALPKTLLLTGASGFIGSQAVLHFRKSGWRVIGTGRRPSQDPDYFRWDLTHRIPDSLLQRFPKPDVILHAAARSSPWGSRQSFYRQNVVATQNILQLAKSLQVQKLIFVSSSSVYYEPRDQFGITESTPLALTPVNEYAASKQQSEAFVKEFPGPWCILRPRAVYGRGDSVLFPRILAAASAGRLPLLVRRGEPAIGDLLSIQNLNNVFLKAATSPEVVGDFNITDNQAVPINEFLLSIFRRLRLREPKRQLSVETAFRVARWLEFVYQFALPWKEPPITRFGVHVFAYSKTFNVQKMLDTFGQPAQSVEEAIDEFTQWVITENPYGKNRVP